MRSLSLVWCHKSKGTSCVVKSEDATALMPLGKDVRELLDWLSGFRPHSSHLGQLAQHLFDVLNARANVLRATTIPLHPADVGSVMSRNICRSADLVEPSDFVEWKWAKKLRGALRLWFRNMHIPKIDPTFAGGKFHFESPILTHNFRCDAPPRKKLNRNPKLKMKTSWWWLAISQVEQFC